MAFCAHELKSLIQVPHMGTPSGSHAQTQHAHAQTHSLVGHQMAFCAHELKSLIKAPRGVDLHSVAARLDAGLYQSTGIEWGVRAWQFTMFSESSLIRQVPFFPFARQLAVHCINKVATLAFMQEVLQSKLLPTLPCSSCSKSCW